MKPSERTELERMALMAEVAREFVHECANFLNTMRLQFRIWDQSPEQARDWSRLQADAQFFIGRLHEWNKFQVPSASVQKVDLARMLRQLAKELETPKSPVHLEVTSPPAPAILVTSAGDLRRLFLLLLECFSARDANNRTVAKVQVESAASAIVARLQIVPAGSDTMADFMPSDSGSKKEGPLLVAACRALAFRLDAEIRVEGQGDSQFLVLELPSQPI